MATARGTVRPERNRPVLILGVALLLLAPPLLWSSFIRLGVAPLFGGVPAFALGWLLVGAGFRPRGSVRRGLAVAALLYLVAGLAWEGLYMLVNPYGDPPSLALLALTPLWPWHVAFVLGLFGLGPR